MYYEYQSNTLRGTAQSTQTRFNQNHQESSTGTTHAALAVETVGPQRSTQYRLDVLDRQNAAQSFLLLIQSYSKEQYYHLT